tara:strand:+ start:475 stop:1320 length:846 start_codon:yes stop_codon:yes gene_type:complete
MARIILTIFLILTNLSCAKEIMPTNTVKHILPRSSFVKIEKTLTVKKVCVGESEKDCKGPRRFQSVASGVVVRNVPGGAYVLTAGHVCAKKYINKTFGDEYELVFNILDINEREYSIDVIDFNVESDVCILWAPDLYQKAVSISASGPEPGDKVYNLAAPLGIFSRDNIVIQEGFYNGSRSSASLYSLPAVGGSSGSPIFNHKGELIGMIHSVFREFSHVSISPRYDNLMNFMYKTIDRHHMKHMIDMYMKYLVGLKKSVEEFNKPVPRGYLRSLQPLPRP